MRALKPDMQRVMEFVKKRTGLDNIFVYYSTPNEFLDKLMLMQKENKYPFFFIDSQRVKYNDVDRTCTIEDMVIATLSKPEWTADKREELSMPILKSVLNTFLDVTKMDMYVRLHKEGDIIQHYFYGKTSPLGYDGIIYPDFVDAIQLRNFQFRLKKECLTK